MATQDTSVRSSAPQDPDRVADDTRRDAMRVLIVSLSTYTSSFNDGKLAELGRQVEAVTAVAAARPTLWGSVCRGRRMETYQVHVLKTRFGRRNATAQLIGLEGIARLTKPMLIHVECEPWQGVAVQSVLLARKLGVPVGVQFAENGPMLRGIGGGVRVAIGRWVLKRCRYAIGWSSESANVARGLAPQLRVETYPGTGVAHVAPLSGFDSQSASSEPWYGSSGGSVAKLAFVGRFSPEKGLGDFLALADRLAPRVPLQVAIAGGKPSHPLLREWLDSRPWARAYGVLPRPKVAELLAASDVLVSPSRTTLICEGTVWPCAPRSDVSWDASVRLRLWRAQGGHRRRRLSRPGGTGRRTR